MVKTIRNVVLTIGLSAFAVGALAAEQDVTISSGASGGTYHGVFGSNMASMLSERGYDVELEESEGSLENIKRVAEGEATIGFTQGDALDKYMDSNPASNIEIMGSLGQECVYIAVRDDGPVSDEGDLGKDGVKIAVGREGSGSAETWDYLRTLEDSYMNAQTHREGGLRAMAKVKSGLYDAFLWVTSPENLNHQFLQATYNSDSGMHLIDVNDWDLNGELPNGQQVYEFRDVVTKEGFFDDEIETPCMDVLVIANTEAGNDLLDDIATMIMMDLARITAVK